MKDDRLEARRELVATTLFQRQDQDGTSPALRSCLP